MSLLSYAAAQGYIRARLSRLVDRATWAELLEANSPADLRHRIGQTAAAMAVTAEGEIRLQVLRGELAAAGMALVRFLPRNSGELTAWYNRRFEVENLKTVFRAVHYRLERKRALASLVPLHSTRWRWEDLMEAGSAAAVIDQIQDSPYAKPLQNAMERYQHKQRLFFLEIALDLFYFQKLVRLIEAQRGWDGADARRFLGRSLAVQNMLWSYRFRIHGRMKPEEIINYTLHSAFAGGLDAVRRVALGSPLAVEAQRIGFRLADGLSEVEALSQVEMMAARERFRQATATMARPLFQLCGVLSYLWLLEDEVRDLAVIVEGKAAGLSGVEICAKVGARLMSMLAPEPMLETNLFVFEPDLEAVTTALARMEALHVEEALPEGWTPSPEWTELSNRYSSLTLRVRDMIGSLGLTVGVGAAPEFNPRPTRDWSEIEPQIASLEIRVQSWQRQLRDAQRDLERLQLGQSQVKLLLPLDVQIEDLRRLQNQTVTIGSMPAENVPRVAEALFQIPFALIPLQIGKDRALVLAASSTDNSAILDRALKSAFFEPVTLPPEALGKPTEALNALERKIGETQKRLNDLDRERQKLASELSTDLSNLWRQADADGKLAEAIRHFPKHGEVFLISGWLPASNLDRVKKAVEKAAGHPVAMEVLKPDPNRQSVPSLVRNPRWLQPFENLVTTFGLTSYNELDPTLIVTVSFLIMYGMMFGDLGHGLLLLFAGPWLWRRFEFGVLIAASGASGMLFGLLYGSAFGEPLLHAAWLHPLEGMWTILLTAVGGGVVLLNIGFVLNLVNAWRSKDWPRFFLEKNGLAGIALYWTLSGGGVGVGFGLLPKRVLLLIPLLGVLLWLQEPLAQWIWRRPCPPIGEALVTGFFELFETVTGYASNSLSFIRLGAFAVAHEGLSGLVVSYSGGRFGWLILLFGTALLVGFEGVNVGIQALRLEYYEFFGRFFQGRGQPFVPLSLHSGGRHASVGVRS